jgi:ribosome maturation factor RimP
MATNTFIPTIEQWLHEIMAAREQLFLVSIKVKPTNNYKIYVDGDNGISIDDCIKINRQLYKKIEEAAIYPDGDFSLEVSSPGVGEPLQLHRQYNKNIGRFVEVVLLDETIIEGKLIAVATEDCIVETTTGKAKKAVTQQIVIQFAQIKKTTVQIKF